MVAYLIKEVCIMVDMSYERFCFLNQDNKINNYLNRKVTIGNVLDKDNIEIFVYKKDNKNCKLLGTKIVSINDIFMKIVSNIVVIILNFVFSKIIIFKNK